MKSSIVPLSAVSAKLACAYLMQQGMNAETARWKYFDETYNQGRERGFVWFSNERVRGFIGMIPVTVATPAGDRNMVWTCDWSVEEWNRNPGIGVRLLSKVQSTYGFVGGVGGSDYTQAIVPNMATRTVADAAVSLRLPLNLKPLLEAAERRLQFLPKLSRTALRQVPLRKRRPLKSGEVRFEQGVSPALAPLFDQSAAGVCCVRYNLAHLAWVGRRPGAVALSCLVGDARHPAAGALLLSHQNRSDQWQVIFRSNSNGGAALETLIASVVAKLVEMRASLLASIVSSRDEEVLNLLIVQGFRERSRMPLYIPEGDGPGSCQEGFRHMSYLDTDLAFEA